MLKLSSDNEGNNENNDDSEVIIAAACGQRFGTMGSVPAEGEMTP